MNFDEYQKLAAEVAIYPSILDIIAMELKSQRRDDLSDQLDRVLGYTDIGKNIYYTTLGLVGEAGEVAEKVKKIMRDNDGVISDQIKENLLKELGDVLWYVAATCDELGISMDAVAQTNITKLFSRRDRGKLQGSGDNR